MSDISDQISDIRKQQQKSPGVRLKNSWMDEISDRADMRRSSAVPLQARELDGGIWPR